MKRQALILMVAGCLWANAGCTTFNTTPEQWEAEQRRNATYPEDSCASWIADLLNCVVGAYR